MIGQPSVIFLKISSDKEHNNFHREILWRNFFEEFLCQSNLNELVLAVFEKHALSRQIHGKLDIKSNKTQHECYESSIDLN